MLGRVNESENVADYLAVPGTEPPLAASGSYIPMVYKAGPLLSGPEFVSLYWGAFSDSQINTMQAWLAGCAGWLCGFGAPPGQDQVIKQYGTFGATVGPWHVEGAPPDSATEDDVKAAIRSATDGIGADVAVDAVGDPAPLAMAISLARDAGTVSGVGAYAGKGEVPLGLAWLKCLDLKLGLANVIAHVDRVLGLLESGKLDPTPLISSHMQLDEAAEAYRIFDRREALKIVLTP